MQSLPLHFLNKSNQKLAGILDTPEGGVTKLIAVFAHCFTCSKDLKSIPNINSSLTEKGISVLRFDMTGIGESEGNFTETNFTTQVQDVISSAEFLSQKYNSPSLFIGHSMGGCAVINAAFSVNSVKAVSIIGTPVTPANISKSLSKTRERVMKEGFSFTTIGGIKFKISKQFFEDVEKYSDFSSYIKKLNKPLLILHSTSDTYTSINNASEIFQHASHPKSFISLDRIDHLMLQKEDAKYIGEMIASWSSYYLK